MITDPLFYAAAIPAVLLFGIAKGGFGGGLGVMAVPMMALVVSPLQAAAVLLPILCLMDLVGLEVPAEVLASSSDQSAKSHVRLAEMCLAQARCELECGHDVVILVDSLTPRTLGALVAMYEHRIFTQGMVWGVNPYDQWGVELGKQLASVILDELESGGVTAGHDGSTQALLEYFLRHRR